MDCSPPGSSIHGILQARILENSHSLLQGIFLTQGSNLSLLHLLHCRCILYQLIYPVNISLVLYSWWLPASFCKFETQKIIFKFISFVIFKYFSILSFAFNFGGSDGKESACNAGDLNLIPGLGRSPGKGSSYPLQYSCLENSMNRGAHGVAKNRTQLSN